MKKRNKQSKNKRRTGCSVIMTFLLVGIFAGIGAAIALIIGIATDTPTIDLDDYTIISLKDKTKIKTGISYELYKEDYKTINTITCKDGTHPLQLSSVNAIPDDYEGWMLCSVTIFDRLNYTDFEWHIMSLKGFYNKKHPDLNPLQHNVTDAMFNGGFNGQLLFRRKIKENN